MSPSAESGGVGAHKSWSDSQATSPAGEALSTGGKVEVTAALTLGNLLRDKFFTAWLHLVMNDLRRRSQLLKGKCQKRVFATHENLSLLWGRRSARLSGRGEGFAKETSRTR